MSFSERRRALIAATMQGGLPSIYQQCEYVSAASVNGAYIDLGFAYDTGCQYEIHYKYIGSSQQIFGAAESSGKYRCMMTAEYIEGREDYYFTGSGDFRVGYYSLSQINTGDVNKVLITMKVGEKPTAKNLVNGIITTAGYACDDYKMTRNLYLLGQNYNTGYRGFGTKTVYLFRYWDKDGKLVRDMIPCYRKADGVIGMWDFASKQFFTNAGGGTFTKGADV